MCKPREQCLPTLVLCFLLILTLISRCLYWADTSWFPAVAWQCLFICVLLGNCFVGWRARDQCDSAVVAALLLPVTGLGWDCLTAMYGVGRASCSSNKRYPRTNSAPRLSCLDLMEDFYSCIRTVNEPAGCLSNVLLGKKQWREWHNSEGGKSQCSGASGITEFRPAVSRLVLRFESVVYFL